MNDKLDKEWGYCRDCKYLRNTCLGTSCKHFGNPWERDLTKGDGCSQFFKPKTK